MRVGEETYKRLPDRLKALFTKCPNPSSPEVLACFPETRQATSRTDTVSDGMFHGGNAGTVYEDGADHSAARFFKTCAPSRVFYCPKASRSERNAGLGLEPNPMSEDAAGSDDDGMLFQIPIQQMRPKQNRHPTVKPLALMRYLLTLVTMPERNLILDPFAGSGTTGVACIELGLPCILIEKDPEHCETIVARVKAAEPTQ